MTIEIPAWVDGVLTPVEKLEVHKRGLKHKAISVFLIRDGHTLLQQRASGKYHSPKLWANACCTHPYWDEDSQVCAQRRLGEEIGITGLKLRYCDTIEYRADVGGGLIEHEVVDMFTAEAGKTLVTRLNPEEVMATKWVPISSLRKMVLENPGDYTPWLRIYIDQFSDLIFQPISV